tara:strand:+ start:134 stop:532 length:399 start_codon:yes stop_codon:yes gene_type:complete
MEAYQMMKIIDLMLFYILNWSVAWILTSSVLLKEPREYLSTWLYNKTINEANKNKSIFRFICNKLEYLITCIICTGIWTSLMLSYLVSKSSYLHIGSSALDYLLISLSTPFFTMVFTNIIYSNTEEEESYDD